MPALASRTVPLSLDGDPAKGINIRHYSGCELILALSITGATDFTSCLRLQAELHDLELAPETTLLQTAILTTPGDSEPKSLTFTAAQLDYGPTAPVVEKEFHLVIAAIYGSTDPENVAYKAQILGTPKLFLRRSHFAGQVIPVPAQVLVYATLEDIDAAIEAALEAQSSEGGNGADDTGLLLKFSAQGRTAGTDYHQVNDTAVEGKYARYGAAGIVMNDSEFTLELQHDALDQNRTLNIPNENGTFATQQHVAAALTGHIHAITDVTNLESTLNSKIGAAYVDEGVVTSLQAHVSDLNNPHQVTATQVGLGNVDNTSDSAKPISSAVQTALTELSNRISALENP